MRQELYCIRGLIRSPLCKVSVGDSHNILYYIFYFFYLNFDCINHFNNASDYYNSSGRECFCKCLGLCACYCSFRKRKHLVLHIHKHTC